MNGRALREVPRPPDISEARSTATALCTCGCNGVKLVYFDERGKPFAMAGFSLEGWTDINREMVRLLLEKTATPPRAS